MIRVFSKDLPQIDYKTNGTKVIQPLKVEVRRELTGDCYVDFECGIEYAPYINEGDVLVAPTPTGDQPFRLLNMTTTRKKISCKAQHLCYDLAYAVVDCVKGEHLNEDSEYESVKTPILNNYMSAVMGASYPNLPIQHTQGDPEETSEKTFDIKQKTTLEAFQEIAAKWKTYVYMTTHTDRHGMITGASLNILPKNYGQDTGYTIRYGKDMTDITKTEDWSDVCTTVWPLGKDGIYLDAGFWGNLDREPSWNTETATETSYALPFAKFVEFKQDDIVLENYPVMVYDEEKQEWVQDGYDVNKYHAALANDLRAQAQAYVNAHRLPLLNYTVKAQPEITLDVGDRVQVIDEVLGVNVTTRVQAYTYDAILNKYKTIELGNSTKVDWSVLRPKRSFYQ